MKIAVIHLDLTTESGDPRMALSCAQAYQSLGHSVIIYTAALDEGVFSELRRGLDIRTVPISGSLKTSVAAPGILGKIKERLKKRRVYALATRKIFHALDNDFDILHFQNDNSYKIGLWYKRVHRKAKTVWIMHNPPFFHSEKASPLADFMSKINSLLEWLTVWHYKSGIDYIITYDHEKAADAERLGIPAKILGIPVDTEKFSAPVKEIRKDQPIVLLGVGALSPARRFEDIIDAVALVRKAGYDARVILACKDYWQDKGYRHQFEKHIEESGIEKFVDARFDGVDDVELVDLMKSAAIFIFPNNVKIWGMAAFEAMAAGVPLIVNRITSVADVLVDKENALFVDSENSTDVAAKAIYLLEHPQEYKRIAANGQKFVCENLEWKSYVRNIIEFTEAS